MTIPQPRLLSAFLVSLSALACSSEEADGGASGVGGAPTSLNTGGALGSGSAPATGGTPSSGGSSSGGGGMSATGGTAAGGATGGASTGGASTGGAASGGAAAGGSASGGAAAGGSGSGGTATGGSGGTTAGSLVEPIERNGGYALDFGDTVFEVDPDVGARISTFSQGGVNVLFPGTSTDTNSSNWGSTFWTSPQAEWSWPPPDAINVDAYSVVVADQVITMTSGAYALGDSTVTIEKSFSATSEPAAVTIVYKINNTGSAAVSVAGWEISRVALGGISFFPEGPGGTSASPSNNLLPTTLDSGVVWFDEANADYRSATDNSGNNKMNGDGAEGWIAHASGSLLFVKTFADVAASGTAPEHGELELYSSSTGDYVEVENQGTYGEISGGESLTYSVRWALRPLTTALEVGTPLAEEARAIATEIGQP